MSVARGQQRTFLALLTQLRPHWRNDRALPARIQSLLRADHRFGSRDRRLYRELIYTTLRYLPWIEPAIDHDPDHAVRLIAWLAADSPATAHFRTDLVADWPACPASVAEKSTLLTQGIASLLAASLPGNAFAPTALLPEWFREHCPEAFAPEQLDALLARAPLWLRLQTDDASAVTREFDQLGWRWQRSPDLSSALQLLDEVDATKTTAFQRGLVEVQDLGSQLLLAAAGVAPGGRWLDACAGAGGKTLQLAARLGPSGQIDAFDVRTAALEELAVRATRAGIPVSRNREAGTRASDSAHRFAAVRIVSTVPDETYDGVLVDAPCGGSGTWRRAPHLKWTTRPADIANAAARQSQLLAQFSQRVRAGGRLIYATCSLSRRENEDVVAGFVAAHRDFATEPPIEAFGAAPHGGGLTFLPARHNTDGFFVAALRRASG